MNHAHCLHSKEPWIDALHAKNLVMAMMEKIVQDYGGVFPKHLCERTNTNDYRVAQELSSLRMSENFSFSGNALRALKAAAPSIPGDSALTAEHAPLGGANWWWFDEPLEIATEDSGAAIVALQWNFLVRVSNADMKRAKVVEDQVHTALTGEKMVRLEIDGEVPFEVKFTAYIQHKTNGLILPSTGWGWNGEESLDHMVAACTRSLIKNGDWNIGQTTNAIRLLSQFFLAACVWVQQEIVEVVPQHVERHLAKRIQKAQKLSARPTVRVIALRKRRLKDNAPKDLDITTHQDSVKQWHCQWVVSGHWRNQPYGPGRILRKLVYVNPYIKGPEELPLREVRPKVYAVMR